jgi:hypothetical protein
MESSDVEKRESKIEGGSSARTRRMVEGWTRPSAMAYIRALLGQNGHARTIYLAVYIR